MVRNSMYALFALVVAAVVVSSGAVVAMGHIGILSKHDNSQNPANDHDNETSEDNNTAGGGGWFMVNNSVGIPIKDTFGFSLNANPGMFNNSSLVFHARELGLTIHAVEFDNVSLNNATVAGHWTAMATGKAVAAGTNWSFTLQVTDIGKGNVDKFSLTLKNDTMTLTWQTNGLGGGNISVMSGELEQDDLNEYHEQDDVEDETPELDED